MTPDTSAMLALAHKVRRAGPDTRGPHAAAYALAQHVITLAGRLAEVEARTAGPAPPLVGGRPTDPCPRCLGSGRVVRFMGVAGAACPGCEGSNHPQEAKP